MVGLPYAARQALQNLDRTIGEKRRGRSLTARGERAKTNLTGITAYWDTQKGSKGLQVVAAGSVRRADDWSGVKEPWRMRPSKQRPRRSDGAPRSPAFRRQAQGGPKKTTLNLEDFDGEVLGAGANGDHSDEGIGTGTEDGEVGGVLVSDEKHGG